MLAFPILLVWWFAIYTLAVLPGRAFWAWIAPQRQSLLLDVSVSLLLTVLFISVLWAIAFFAQFDWLPQFNNDPVQGGSSIVSIIFGPPIFIALIRGALFVRSKRAY